MGNNSSEKKNEILNDKRVEDTHEEIEDWCESFVDPEDEMTDSDKQVNEWCRLESGSKVKEKTDK